MSQRYKKIRLSSPQKGHSDSAIRDLLADIDFDDDFWGISDQKENSPENEQQQQQLENETGIQFWKRCTVQSIEECGKGSVLLQLKDDSEGSTWSCRLESPWNTTKLTVGDLISIKPVWCQDKQIYRVDKDHGYVITLPDHLLAGTTMMGSLFCRRKGALQELFKGMDSDNEIVCKTIWP